MPRLRISGLGLDGWPAVVVGSFENGNAIETPKFGQVFKVAWEKELHLVSRKKMWGQFCRRGHRAFHSLSSKRAR